MSGIGHQMGSCIGGELPVEVLGGKSIDPKVREFEYLMVNKIII